MKSAPIPIFNANKLLELGDAFVIYPANGNSLEFAAVWALKERGLFMEKPLVCIGEQWNKYSDYGFYSEQ